jgi:hypothetical protein
MKQGCRTVFCAAALFWLFLLGVRVIAMAVAGGAVAVAALALPAALSGDPDYGQRKQHRQYHQRNDPTKCQHIHPSISFMQHSVPSIHDLAAKSNSLPRIFVQGAVPAPARSYRHTAGARYIIFAAKGLTSKKVK